MDIVSVGAEVAVNLGIGALVVSSGYGSIKARLEAVEDRLKDTVTHSELNSLIDGQNRLIEELRGLRAEILNLYRKGTT